MASCRAILKKLYFNKGVISKREYKKLLRNLKTEPGGPGPGDFEFCSRCKEYDQERHYCPRHFSVIYQVLEELKGGEE